MDNLVYKNLGTLKEKKIHFSRSHKKEPSFAKAQVAFFGIMSEGICKNIFWDTHRANLTH